MLGLHLPLLLLQLGQNPARLHLVVGVLKTGQPFDPAWGKTPAAA